MSPRLVLPCAREACLPCSSYSLSFVRAGLSRRNFIFFAVSLPSSDLEHLRLGTAQHLYCRDTTFSTTLPPHASLAPTLREAESRWERGEVTRIPGMMFQEFERTDVTARRSSGISLAIPLSITAPRLMQSFDLPLQKFLTSSPNHHTELPRYELQHVTEAVLLLGQPLRQNPYSHRTQPRPRLPYMDTIPTEETTLLAIPPPHARPSNPTHHRPPHPTAAPTLSNRRPSPKHPVYQPTSPTPSPSSRSKPIRVSSGQAPTTRKARSTGLWSWPLPRESRGRAGNGCSCGHAQFPSPAEIRIFQTRPGPGERLAVDGPGSGGLACTGFVAVRPMRRGGGVILSAPVPKRKELADFAKASGSGWEAWRSTGF
ncbi:hypothetical protein EIP91_002253 [Steccherinum ochraceum]|uniref:Uncharacterized protein n=1 Tax=Steccherinum ochraceum TaxID=92696 RepID=A0A4R0RT68_9APHY|nr:hypothetical protein EIP91_002253 [Steccherinum ochraceum]